MILTLLMSPMIFFFHFLNNLNLNLMFDSIRSTRPRRNKFSLTHEVKLSCNMGDLVPIFCEEIVPGDKFRVSSEIMMRLAPMLAPIMHRVDVFTHYFFVPNRIIWNEWEDFITGGEDGLQQPEWPWMSYQNLFGQGASFVSVGSLLDYFGLPPLGASPAEDLEFSVLPFRAYQEIYNEYYRDQNLEAKVNNPRTSGVQIGAAAAAAATLRKRAWEKDYFTSALPWAQRGNPVSIPTRPRDEAIIFPSQSSGGGPFTVPENIRTNSQGGPQPYRMQGTTSLQLVGIDSVEGIDLNDLRRSNALQKWLELAARGGSRYIEQIRNFFGVTSSDARLQRPEYLGGGKQNIVISEVLQTAATEDSGTTETPLGEMAGHGVSVGSTNRFARSFEEHGFVIGIMSVLPRTAYQQGVHRMWSRMDKFDYYFPQFAHLGEQAILNKELFYDSATSADQAETWGYQSRYAEYKHKASQVAGDFRTTLNYWHMGRIFPAGTVPPLNADFVKADPTHRIFANIDPADDKLWVQILNRVDALRPMPYYGTPRL